MTMILTLVLPISLTCMALSVVSVVQARELNYTNSQNGFSSYLDKIAMTYAYEEIDPLKDFPSVLAKDMSFFYRTISNWRGEVFASRDGHEAWRIVAEGKSELTGEDFEALSHSRHHYSWVSPDGAFRVLAAFPYDLSLSSLPAWFWFGMILSVVTVLYCPLLYKRLKLDILDPMAVLDTALESVKNDRSYRIPPQPERHSDEFLHLFDEFNVMAQEVQSSYEKDVKMLETEMDNLRLQVNPHMLLNSYNMIYALAQSKNFSVIRDYSLCLVDYFRYQKLTEIILRAKEKVEARRKTEQMTQYGQQFIQALSQETKGDTANALDTAVGYIDQHLAEELSVRDLAAASFISADHLTRLFKKKFGMTVSEYIQDRRIRLAGELLKKGDATISMVANTVGYGNYSYFTEQFKKHFGVTPREYQKNAKE